MLVAGRPPAEIPRTAERTEAGRRGERSQADAVGGTPVDPSATDTVAAPAYAFFSGLFPPLAPDRRDGEHGHQHDALLDYVREHGIDVDVEGRTTAARDTASGEMHSLR